MSWQSEVYKLTVTNSGSEKEAPSLNQLWCRAPFSLKIKISKCDFRICRPGKTEPRALPHLRAPGVQPEIQARAYSWDLTQALPFCLFHLH